MTGIEAYYVFEHLRDTGTIQAFGEMLGQAFAQGLAKEAAKLDKEQTAAPALAAAAEKLLKIIDKVRGDSEGRYPLPDPGCIACTSGTAPDQYNTGLCGEHAARAALRQAGRLP